MTSLTLTFNDVNFSPVELDNQIWLTGSELSKALGYAKTNAVTQIFERNADEFNSSMTQLIENPHNLNLRLRVYSLRGCHLVAMFSKTSIAKQFRKWVLDILDREVLSHRLEGRQSISPEQQALLHEIVDRRSKGERKIYAEMWSRHNRHFKIPRYAELLAIHFPESVHYLETMVIKAKPEQTEMKALPFPAEVIQVAQQINNEFNGGRFMSWFVSAKDGVLSAQPLPHGYYPVNVKEFTRHFDGVLNVLYGSEVLLQGRYYLSQE